MRFTRFEVVTSTQVEELLAYNINEAGIEGVEIVNKTGLTKEDKERMFIDILPVLEDDGVSILRFFISETENVDKVKNLVKNEIERLSEFFDVGEGKILTSPADDNDWKDKWKEFFKPFYIDDIYITPTWIDEKKDEKLSIRIDPGAAFGTGLHETTRLCLRGLKKHIDNTTEILDIGCGSGILSILADKLGAKRIVAVDIDENATRITEENFKINNLNKEKYQIYTGDMITDENLCDIVGYKRYDVIVANLLAEIVVAMSGRFLPHLKKGGVLIASGILAEKEDKVKKALRNSGFIDFEVLEDGEWISIIAR